MMKRFVPLFEEFEKETDFQLDFPDLRQIDNFDCGAVSLQAVLIYYGIDVREDDLLKLLGTTRTDIIKNGTKLSAMIDVAKHYGLDAEVHYDMSIQDMMQHIENKIPVILLIQAWRDYSKDAEWKQDEDDGHYVVAIGRKKDTVTIEDPSLTVRGWISMDELEERWHGLGDDNKTEVRHAAVVIKGKPKYNSSDYVHID